MAHMDGREHGLRYSWRVLHDTQSREFGLCAWQREFRQIESAAMPTEEFNRKVLTANHHAWKCKFRKHLIKRPFEGVCIIDFDIAA